MSTVNGRAKRTVVKKTANYTVTNDDCGKIFSNEGASGAITFALPAATVGMWFGFAVSAAQAVQIDPNGTEKVSLHTGVLNAAGKYATCSTAGGFLHICCLKAGEWQAVASANTWTAEP